MVLTVLNSVLQTGTATVTATVSVRTQGRLLQKTRVPPYLSFDGGELQGGHPNLIPLATHVLLRLIDFCVLVLC